MWEILVWCLQTHILSKLKSGTAQIECHDSVQKERLNNELKLDFQFQWFQQFKYIQDYVPNVTSVHLNGNTGRTRVIIGVYIKEPSFPEAWLEGGLHTSSYPLSSDPLVINTTLREILRTPHTKDPLNTCEHCWTRWLWALSSYWLKVMLETLTLFMPKSYFIKYLSLTLSH